MTMALFTTAGCGYEMRINDVPIASDPQGIAVLQDGLTGGGEQISFVD